MPQGHPNVSAMYQGSICFHLILLFMIYYCFDLNYITDCEALNLHFLCHAQEDIKDLLFHFALTGVFEPDSQINHRLWMRVPQDDFLLKFTNTTENHFVDPDLLMIFTHQSYFSKLVIFKHKSKC